MSGRNEEEDDDENYRDPEDKWSGFHFTRVTCISILILIIMIVALILDSLSVWGTKRECSDEECFYDYRGGCDPSTDTDGCTNYYCGYSNCNNNDKSDCDLCKDSNPFGQCCRYEYDDNGVTKQSFVNKAICEANGDCGWRTATTKWINGGHPACQVLPESSSGESWTSTYNYADLCYDNDDDEACMAMDGGNVYMAFTIFAIIFNLFALCIIAPLYCRDKSLFPCDFCNEKTHWVLGVLYMLCVFCNFIPVVVWLGAADMGMCDDADPYANIVFDDPGVNYPGYSLGGLIICLIGHIVTTCAVCCCWGDNRRYGDDRDTAKVQRQKEKEKYREEQEMANNNNNNNQQNNETYSYH